MTAAPLKLRTRTLSGICLLLFPIQKGLKLGNVNPSMHSINIARVNLATVTSENK